MGTKTTRLDLLKPGENDYYNQQTEQADNWQKVDDYAVYTDRDKNAIWGGLDGGGKIEDPTVVKEVGKRYIGADGKAYICLVPSNINNSTNYTPCNVVDNLESIKKLNSYVSATLLNNTSDFIGTFTRYGNLITIFGVVMARTETRTFGLQFANLLPQPRQPISSYSSSVKVDGLYIVNVTLNTDKTITVGKADITGTIESPTYVVLQYTI